jgi:hypothetical protein
LLRFLAEISFLTGGTGRFRHTPENVLDTLQLAAMTRRSPGGELIDAKPSEWEQL